MPDPGFAELAKMFDHSLLQQTLTDAELEAACAGGRRVPGGFRLHQALCGARAKEWLTGSGVAVGTVIGFPHGGHVTASK